MKSINQIATALRHLRALTTPSPAALRRGLWAAFCIAALTVTATTAQAQTTQWNKVAQLDANGTRTSIVLNGPDAVDPDTPTQQQTCNGIAHGTSGVPTIWTGPFVLRSAQAQHDTLIRLLLAALLAGNQVQLSFTPDANSRTCVVDRVRLR